MSSAASPQAPAPNSPPPAPPPTPPTISADDRLAVLEKALVEQLDLFKKASEPRRPNGLLDMLATGQAPHVTTGEVNHDSRPYSFIKAAALAQGVMSPDECKVEADIGRKLKEWYKDQGMYGGNGPGFRASALLVPLGHRYLPPDDTDARRKLKAEIGLRTKAWDGEFDPDEADSVLARIGKNDPQSAAYWKKALGTVSDTAGGVLVGFPSLGELVDVFRNLEVMSNAGATEIALPPNGRLQLPKLTDTATAFWVGEGNAITESQEKTGGLLLEAKKLGILVKLNNELLRFTTPTTEGMVRMDMARVGALKADLGMLEGTGGTQIKGLITYPSASTWTTGTDPLLAYTVTSNLFQPNDPKDMWAVMPDTAGAPTAWVMRRQLWAKIANRRADAVSASDGKGPFVFDLTRSAADPRFFELEGTKIVASSQVSATRGNGSQTYAILGNFGDWVIGRFGVMEFLASGLGDTPLVNDQTWIRAIMHIDAGPRHASSFVFADAINIA